MLRHTNAYIKALDATHHINAIDDDDTNERGRYQQRLKRHQQQPAMMESNSEGRCAFINCCIQLHTLRDTHKHTHRHTKIEKKKSEKSECGVSSV